MWKLDDKEIWASKNWCFWTVVLEKTLRNSLDSKEIKPVNPKGNQPWIFTGRTDVEAEAPILRPPDAKDQLIRKDADAGKDWRQEEKGTIEDEMVGWHHRLNGREFEQTPGNGEGQGSLVCCSPCGHKQSHRTERLTPPPGKPPSSKDNWQIQEGSLAYFELCAPPADYQAVLDGGTSGCPQSQEKQASCGEFRAGLRTLNTSCLPVNKTRAARRAWIFLLQFMDGLGTLT